MQDLERITSKELDGAISKIKDKEEIEEILNETAKDKTIPIHKKQHARECNNYVLGRIMTQVIKNVTRKNNDPINKNTK